MRDYTKQETGCCTFVHTFEVRHGTMDAVTGEYRETGTETVTGPCNVPLFGDCVKTGRCQLHENA